MTLRVSAADGSGYMLDMPVCELTPLFKAVVLPGQPVLSGAPDAVRASLRALVPSGCTAHRVQDLKRWLAMRALTVALVLYRESADVVSVCVEALFDDAME